MRKIQYLCFSCRSFPAGSFYFEFLKSFDKFIIDNAKFFKRTSYLHLTLLFKPDGPLKGSEHSTFHDLLDFEYTVNMGGLIACIKVLESEWTGKGRKGPELERVFELKTVETLLHLSKTYSLDTLSLENALLEKKVVSESELESLKSKITQMTFKRAKKPNGKPFEICLRLSEMFGSDSERDAIGQLEEQITQVLEDEKLGKVHGNEIGAGTYTILCVAKADAEKTIIAITRILKPVEKNLTIIIENKTLRLEDIIKIESQ